LLVLNTDINCGCIIVKLIRLRTVYTNVNQIGSIFLAVVHHLHIS